MASHSSEETLQTNVDKSSASKNDINILLLGPTGVGKSTFINAFANYLIFDTLDAALSGEMQVLIPSSFIFVNAETFADELITVGQQDHQEEFSDKGQSATQVCRSFVFPIGDRKLRIMDTPGVGDTRGLDQDKENLQNVLAFLSQYDHLNAICILLKPNEERLTVTFKYCVNELLRHLHSGAKDNLVFVFTNARTTGYKPGATARCLRILLSEIQQKHHVEISMNHNNTFAFDSEPFRCLALQKHGIELEDDFDHTFKKSWDHAIKESNRFLSNVVKLPLHPIRSTISLNQADQLILKLPRPIAETQRLIEENIELAKQYQRQIIKDPQLIQEGLPQNIGNIRKLKFPRTVCTSDRCRRVINENGVRRIEYTSICHDECYLKNVLQETLADPELQNCSAMDYQTDHCYECGCFWSEHIHITYEYLTHATRLVLKNDDEKESMRSDAEIALDKINRYIADLIHEQTSIQDTYRQLVEFLHANAMIPFNDAYIDYLQYFIEEERVKKRTDDDQMVIIQRLEKIKEEFKTCMDTFKETLATLDDEDKIKHSTLNPADVASLIQHLYELPITGGQIREQMEGIETVQDKTTGVKERIVSLSSEAFSSRVMQALTGIFTRTE